MIKAYFSKAMACSFPQRRVGITGLPYSISQVVVRNLIISALLLSVSLGNSETTTTQKCACDLTRERCDAHCCCDPDCFDELKQGFECSANGTSNDGAHRCYSQSWVHAVNPRTDLWVVVEDLSGLLCVVVDNNVLEGPYFTNEKSVKPDRIDGIKAENKDTSFADRIGSGQTVDSKSRGYRFGDALKIHRALTRADGKIVSPISDSSAFDATEVQEVVQNLLTLSPGVLGHCAESSAQPVRFMVDVPKTSCWLPPIDLSSACSTVLNPASDLAWLLRKRHLSQDARCIQRCIDPTTNKSCPVQTTQVDGTTKEAPCPPTPDNSPTSLVRDANSKACTCFGALRNIKYVFHYGRAEGDSPAISRVDLHVTLQDLRSEDCDRPTTCFRRSTEVRFEQVVEDPYAVHPRSGNPGYLVGLPLLVGTCKRYENTRCVEYVETAAKPSVATVSGILPDGTCATSEKSNAPGRDVEIRFGEDIVLGCVIRLTREELKSICKQGSDSGFANLLPVLSFGRLGNSWTAVAALGSISDASEWVEVEQHPKTEVLDFDEENPGAASTSTCSGAVVGLDYEILWSPFGEVASPQARIVAARAKHRMGEVRFTRANPAESQAFEFTVTASFIRYDTGGEQVDVPPRPELPIWLPHDLFYPFALGSNARSWSSTVWLLTVICTSFSHLIA
eukprot:TRINITY_DN27005_c0_g2_i1.p1 TRINITY_DN27005_c0_g2~~TRINITY_DN27005_c0_g2_i1.p1  ORF type:complete len:677 (+),score=67.37 TRINITY_DN27005_c0_g2_i1:45-2075(+)